MSEQKYVFWAVLGGIILGILGLFLLWRTPVTTRPLSQIPPPSLPSRGGLGVAPEASPSGVGIMLPPTPTAPSGPAFAPFSEQSFFGAPAPFFEKQLRVPIQAPLPFQAPPRRLTDSQIRQLTKEAQANLRAPQPRSYSVAEVFHLQYPNYYLDYLNTLQDVMLDDGYISPVQKKTFKTHNNVYEFVRTYINFLADRGDLIFRSRTDRDQYINSVLANLLLLNVLEADLLEKGVIVAK